MSCLRRLPSSARKRSPRGFGPLFLQSKQGLEDRVPTSATHMNNCLHKHARGSSAHTDCCITLSLSPVRCACLIRSRCLGGVLPRFDQKSNPPAAWLVGTPSASWYTVAPLVTEQHFTRTEYYTPYGAICRGNYAAGGPTDDTSGKHV